VAFTHIGNCNTQATGGNKKMNDLGKTYQLFKSQEATQRAAAAYHLQQAIENLNPCYSLPNDQAALHHANLAVESLRILPALRKIEAQ
jgi:hypothetical protein